MFFNICFVILFYLPFIATLKHLMWYSIEMLMTTTMILCNLNPYDIDYCFSDQFLIHRFSSVCPASRVYRKQFLVHNISVNSYYWATTHWRNSIHSVTVCKLMVKSINDKFWPRIITAEVCLHGELGMECTILYSRRN